MWILSNILFANFTVTIGYLEFSLTFIVCFICGYILLVYRSNILYLLFASFTIMIGYASFLLWEQEAPILLLFPRIALLPVLTVFFIFFLHRRFTQRLIVLLIGLCSGELLFALILSSYQITKMIGDFIFLDTIMVCLFLLMVIEIPLKLKLMFTSRPTQINNVSLTNRSG